MTDDLQRRIDERLSGRSGTVTVSKAGDALLAEPVEGFHPDRFTRRMDTFPNVDRVLDEAESLAELVDIAVRRRDAVRAAGHDAADPPAWAFIGHPLVRAFVTRLKGDPATFHPLRDDEFRAQTRLNPTVHDIRIGHVGARIEIGGQVVHLDVSNEMARVRLEGTWPDVVLEEMGRRTLGDVFGAEGLGAAAADRIRDSWQDSDALGFTALSRLVPLADPPPGVDVGWLLRWQERHYR